MEKCLFVYNPESGNSRIKKNETKIVQILSKKYDVIIKPSQYKGNIGKIVLEYGNNVDLIVFGGGDGTVNEVVNNVMKLEKQPTLGYIPAGTVNDFAHSLKIPKNIRKAAENIIDGDIYKHDIFKINDTYGVYICGAGIFTETSYETKQLTKKALGKLAYAFHCVKDVFNTPAINLKIVANDKVITGKYALMLFINSRSVAGMKVNKKASLNDGMIDLMLIKNSSDIVNIIGIHRIFKFFLNFSNKKLKGIEYYKFDKFRCEMPDSVSINVDGEKVAEGSFDFEMRKEAISIIVPSKKKLNKTKEIETI